MRWGINIPNLKTFLVESMSLMKMVQSLKENGYGVLWLWSFFQLSRSNKIVIWSCLTILQGKMIFLTKYTQQMQFLYEYTYLN